MHILQNSRFYIYLFFQTDSDEEDDEPAKKAFAPSKVSLSVPTCTVYMYVNYAFAYSK